MKEVPLIRQSLCAILLGVPNRRSQSKNDVVYRSLRRKTKTSIDYGVIRRYQCTTDSA